jgi:hypothetical protein
MSSAKPPGTTKVYLDRGVIFRATHVVLTRSIDPNVMSQDPSIECPLNCRPATPQSAFANKRRPAIKSAVKTPLGTCVRLIAVRGTNRDSNPIRSNHTPFAGTVLPGSVIVLL